MDRKRLSLNQNMTVDKFRHVNSKEHTINFLAHLNKTRPKRLNTVRRLAGAPTHERPMLCESFNSRLHPIQEETMSTKLTFWQQRLPH
jgi:hypothetical protein